MIFKIVDADDDDGHIANAKSHLSVTTSTGETKIHLHAQFDENRVSSYLGIPLRLRTYGRRDGQHKNNMSPISHFVGGDIMISYIKILHKISQTTHA